MNNKERAEEVTEQAAEMFSFAILEMWDALGIDEVALSLIEQGMDIDSAVEALVAYVEDRTE